MPRLVDADALLNTHKLEQLTIGKDWGVDDLAAAIEVTPTVEAIPVEWLNERHRRCCEEADTDMMDAITMLCNEYHVWLHNRAMTNGIGIEPKEE